MGKKSEDKSTDELLKDALIKKKEQPYQLPENWLWINSSIAFVNVTSSEKKLKQKEYLEAGEFPVIDQGADFIGGYTNHKSLVYLGELPVVIFGDHTRIVKYVDFKFVQGADGVKVLLPKKLYEPKFLYYFLRNAEITNRGYSRHYKLIRALPFPLPPLPEQKRIVGKLESMLCKLKEARELIREARDTFEKRRAAILHKAFTGELTKKWRKKSASKNKMIWKTVKLQDITDTISDGDHQAPPKASHGIPFIIISNIKNNEVDLTNTKFVPTHYYNNLKDFRKPRVGDILYTVTGSYGIPVLIKTSEKFCFQRHIALLRPNNSVSNKFLFYILNSQFVYQQATEVATGTAQLTVPLSGLRNIEIPCPSIDEQKEIVRLLDNLLDHEKEAQALIDLEEQINLIEKSILAKAFRSQLGTNDPNDEPASVLIEHILATVGAEANKSKEKTMQKTKPARKKELIGKSK